MRMSPLASYLCSDQKTSINHSTEYSLVTCHTSAISGIILSGAVPIYISPAYSQTWDMALGISPADIQAALSAHPDAKAVLIVSPTYYGICSNVQAIAQLTQASATSDETITGISLAFASVNIDSLFDTGINYITIY